MLRQFLFLLAVAAFAACAGESAGSVVVDLDQVVAQGKVSPVGGLTSAGQPDEAAFSVFAESGYVAVIDMRTGGEDRGLDEATVVAGLGMEYVEFPVSGKTDITLEKAAELDALLSQYDEPVLLHCGSGNRVGALLALRDFRESGDAEKALQVGKDGGLTRLEGQVKEILESSESD